MSNQLRKSSTPQTMEEKLEQLNKLYIKAFETFLKIVPKREKNYKEIKDCCTSLRDFSKFCKHDQIRYYSLLIASPVEKSTNKIIEKQIDIMTTIMQQNLLEPQILQEMCQKFIAFIHKTTLYSNDENLQIQILQFYIAIYSHEHLVFHYEHLKLITKMIVAFYLLFTQNQPARYTMSHILDFFIQRVSIAYHASIGLNTTTITNTNFNLLTFNKSNNTSLTMSSSLSPPLLNQHSLYCKKYINFISDLIEISTFNENNKDIINKYKEVFTTSSMSKDKVNIKTEIEKLNLLQYETIKHNETGAPIGKYGWCIQCRNSANAFSNKLNFPVCLNNECENEFMKLGIFIDNERKFKYDPYRHDYISFLKYFVKLTDSNGDDDREKDPNEVSVHAKVRQFGLNTIHELIDSGSKYFLNDTDIIKLISNDVINLIAKTSVSNEISLLRLSIQIFIDIVKAYRDYLKDQIQLFINNVLIAILESENFAYEYKEVVLQDGLLNLVENVEFFVEIYVNYDCDINCNAVFYKLISVLTHFIQGSYKRTQTNTAGKSLEERKLRNKCLEFFTKFISNLSEVVERNYGQQLKLNDNNNNNIETNTNNVNNNGESVQNESFIMQDNEGYTEQEITMNEDIKDKINHNLRMKDILGRATTKFNALNPDKCMNFLIEQKMIFDETTFNSIKEKYIEIATTNPLALKDFLNEHNSELTSLIIENKYIHTIMQLPFVSTPNALVFLLYTLSLDEIQALSYKDYQAFEMARFVRSSNKLLKRDLVGNFLCSGKPFNVKTVTYFIDSFSFRGVHILEALRALFSELPLIGEGQIVDRIVQIFGQKYHRENPNELKNPDMSYYISFSIIMLNTDLHRDEVEKKMTLSEYIQRFIQMCGEGAVENSYLEDIYNRIRDNPIVIPGQKLSRGPIPKTKQDLMKQERETIFNSVIINTTQSNTINANFIRDIDNDAIRHLLDGAWSNFFAIFSQLLADFEDEKMVSICVQNILLLARTCYILHLDTNAEAYINIIINVTHLLEGKEMNIKNLICTQQLIDFLVNNGKYVRTSWDKLLLVISKIDFYFTILTEGKTFSNEIQKRWNNKAIEEIEIKNFEMLQKYNFDLKIEPIYQKTEQFEEEVIMNFIKNLCEVSRKELDEYIVPRIFSLHKLIEVASYNLHRIQIEWIKIWKEISFFLVSIIKNQQTTDPFIWNQILDLLKQTICKSLQKKDIDGYGFQKDLFAPFEIIFDLTANNSSRSDTIIINIHFIVGSYTQYIRSGWGCIFNILKKGIKRNNTDLNKSIQLILDKISNDFTVFDAGIHQEIFRGYVECLSLMFLYKNLKKNAFDALLKLLEKIIGSMSNKENDINKQLEYIKIVFYGLDDLITVDINEHLNLLFNIISYNTEIIFSKEKNAFLFLYYSYFKPHLCSLLFALSSRAIESFDKCIYDNKTNYKYPIIPNQGEVLLNLIYFLEKSMQIDIDSLSQKDSPLSQAISPLLENANDSKTKNNLISLLKSISDNYKNDPLYNKLNQLSKLDINNFESEIELFFENFDKMLQTQTNINNINYNYFYENLLITLNTCAIYNKHSSIALKTIQNSFNNELSNMKYSEYYYQTIFAHNTYLLSLLYQFNTTNANALNDLIEYTECYLKFTLFLIESTSYNEYSTVFMAVSSILNKYLSNNQSSVILNHQKGMSMLIVIEDIKKTILDKTTDYNSLIGNNSDVNFGIMCLKAISGFFEKNNLNTENNLPLVKVIQSELNNVLPKFIQNLNENEMKNVFTSLIEFVDSVNIDLRTAAKNMLKYFVDNNFCIFVSSKK